MGIRFGLLIAVAVLSACTGSSGSSSSTTTGASSTGSTLGGSSGSTTVAVSSTGASGGSQGTAASGSSTGTTGSTGSSLGSGSSAGSSGGTSGTTGNDAYLSISAVQYGGGLADFNVVDGFYSDLPFCTSRDAGAGCVASICSSVPNNTVLLINSGEISVSGPHLSALFDFVPGAGYALTSGTGYFDGGDVLTAQAPGGPGSPTFSLATTSPALLTMSVPVPAPDWHDGQVHIDATQPLAFSWTGGTAVGHAYVNLYAWEAPLPDGGLDASNSESVTCEFDPATGMGTVPSTAMSALIHAPSNLAVYTYSDTLEPAFQTDVDLGITNQAIGSDSFPFYLSSVSFDDGAIVWSADAGAAISLSGDYPLTPAAVNEFFYLLDDGGPDPSQVGVNVSSTNSLSCGNTQPGDTWGSLFEFMVANPDGGPIGPGTFPMLVANSESAASLGYPDGGGDYLAVVSGTATLTDVQPLFVAGTFSCQLVDPSGSDAGAVSGSFKAPNCP